MASMLTWLIGLSIMSVCLVSSWTSGPSSMERSSAEGVNSSNARDAQDQKIDVSKKSLIMDLVREFLRLLQRFDVGRSKRDLVGQTYQMIRNILRLILLAFMGFLGEEQCMERIVCEAGGMLNRYNPKVSLVYTVLHYFVPARIGKYLNIARNSAQSNYCDIHRCGIAYHNDGGNKTLD